MTGSGTKSDPYIVYTWAEFLSAIVQSDVYIELGGDIIVNAAVSPSSPYAMNYKELNGKGHYISNIFVSDFHYLFEGVRNNMTKNLTFKNTYLNRGCFLKFQSDYGNYKYAPTFRNCHFSVECANTADFIDHICTYSYCVVFRDCTFNLLCDNSNFSRQRGSADNRRPMILDNCYVEINGTIFSSVIEAQLVNTRVTGEVEVLSPDSTYPCVMIINAGSYEYYTAEFMQSNSIVDIKIHNNQQDESILYVSGSYYYDIDSNAIYCTQSLFVDTEDIENISVTSYAPYKNCTSAQIHSEAYLKSQGFAYEEIYNDRYVRTLTANFPRTPASGANRTYIDTGVIGSRYYPTSIKWEFLNSADTTYSEYWVMGASTDEGGSLLGTIFGAESKSSMVTWQDQTYNISDFHDPSSPYGMVQVKLSAFCDNTTWREGQDIYNIFIGCLNWNGNPRSGAECKVYEAQIWDTNDNLVRDYVPAYDTVDQEYGLFDKVNNVFYGNASSGSESPEITSDSMPFKFVNGELVHSLASAVVRLGAFYNATTLTDVQIPESVKKIGKYAFANTALSSVTIASDCVYYDTSFPAGCVVYFYS